MNEDRRARLIEKLAAKFQQVGRRRKQKSSEEIKRLALRGKIPRIPKTPSSIATPGALAETATPAQAKELA